MWQNKRVTYVVTYVHTAARLCVFRGGPAVLDEVRCSTTLVAQEYCKYASLLSCCRRRCYFFSPQRNGLSDRGAVAEKKGS
jgi:hypothetical protein